MLPVEQPTDDGVLAAVVAARPGRGTLLWGAAMVGLSVVIGGSWWWVAPHPWPLLMASFLLCTTGLTVMASTGARSRVWAARERADPTARIRVRWSRLGVGYFHRGRGEVRVDAAGLRFVDWETMWWDVAVVIGATLLGGYSIPVLGWIAVPIALRMLGLPRRRIVDAWAAPRDVEAIEVRGRRFMVRLRGDLEDREFAFVVHPRRRDRLLATLRRTCPDAALVGAPAVAIAPEVAVETPRRPRRT